MAQRILGIDVGHWSVKVVLLEAGFRSYRVVEAEEALVEPPTEEIPLSERQSEALRVLLTDDRFRSDARAASLPAEQVAIRFLKLPFSDLKKIEQVMEFELEDLLPFDLSDGIYHYQVLERASGRGKASSVSLAAATRSEALRACLHLLEEGGADPKYLQVDALGLYALYTHFLSTDGSRPATPASMSPNEVLEATEEMGLEEFEARPKGRLIIDIGHARSLVLAASESGIAHARVIRAGGKDVTSAIAKAYELSWADAEAGKHADAVLSTARHPAANDETQRLSEVVERGLSPLVRELRRTLAAIRRERKVDITRIDLLGGGARLQNIAHYFAEALGVPVAAGVAVEQDVEPFVAEERKGAFALALSAALRVGGDAPVSSIDMRRGEFAFSGGLQHFRKRVPILASTTMALLLLFGIYGFAKKRSVNGREAAVNQEFCSITKQVIGQEICEPDVALSVMQNPPSELGNFQLPEVSAFDILRDLSERTPKDVKLTDISIDTERVVIEGEAGSFDVVDQLVTAYGASKCISNIRKDRLRKRTVGEGVEFQLKMKAGCNP